MGHQAASQGLAEMARLLLLAGADVEAKDKRGETPLRRAIRSAGFHLKRNELEEFKLDVSAVKVLIKFNASVEAAKGSTEAQWDFDRGINQSINQPINQSINQSI